MKSLSSLLYKTFLYSSAKIGWCYKGRDVSYEGEKSDTLLLYFTVSKYMLKKNSRKNSLSSPAGVLPSLHMSLDLWGTNNIFDTLGRCRPSKGRFSQGYFLLHQKCPPAQRSQCQKQDCFGSPHIWLGRKKLSGSDPNYDILLFLIHQLHYGRAATYAVFISQWKVPMNCQKKPEKSDASGL